MCEQKETCEWITIKVIQEIDCVCPICKGQLKNKLIQRQYKPVNDIFPFDLSVDGYICEKCGEVFFPQESIQKITNVMNGFLRNPINAKPEEIQFYSYRKIKK